MTCPNGQQAQVTAGRQKHPYRVAIDADPYGNCPDAKLCRSRGLRRSPERVACCSQQAVGVALRRQRDAEMHSSNRNPRTAVEATVRSVRRVFYDGKVPARGELRMSTVTVALAVMSNLRRAYRHRVRQREQENARQAETKNQAVRNGYNRSCRALAFPRARCPSCAFFGIR